MTNLYSIENNLKDLGQNIAHQALQAGRDPKTIRLIAVSKTHPVDAVRLAVEAGHIQFGENRVQEAIPKIEALNRADVEWHLIGHLQKNKAKFCAGKFHWIHSLDSKDLAALLEKKCAEAGWTMQVLIQVNIFGEDSKEGLCRYDDVLELGTTLLQCKHLVWRGLMTIGDPTLEEAATQAGFRELSHWQTKMKQHLGYEGLTELSMGMSDDYPSAIREGATMIRIGRAIFGQRG
ncbi:MAG: YggS family pyridoxal phosphate-dependent enzyme [SAR324 cluster bacterium]|nr:YggS family pyridoxal phosphate-dependent enzyme [SAR324 cluster bacterium]